MEGNLAYRKGRNGLHKRRCLTCDREYRKQYQARPEYNAKAAAKAAEWRRNRPAEAKAERRRQNLRMYGLTPRKYAVMLELQGGVCAICRCACKTGRNLAVDHDHDTGVVRGLLCNDCNNGLGRFADDTERLEAAINYLKSTTAAEAAA